MRNLRLVRRASCVVVLAVIALSVAIVAPIRGALAVSAGDKVSLTYKGDPEGGSVGLWDRGFDIGEDGYIGYCARGYHPAPAKSSSKVYTLHDIDDLVSAGYVSAAKARSAKAVLWYGPGSHNGTYDVSNPPGYSASLWDEWTSGEGEPAPSGWRENYVWAHLSLSHVLTGRAANGWNEQAARVAERLVAYSRTDAGFKPETMKVYLLWEGNQGAAGFDTTDTQWIAVWNPADSATGSITVRKNVVGGESDATFTFRVRVHTGSTTHLDQTFTLKGGQTKRFDDLPAGASYEVSETGGATHYDTTWERRTGTVADGRDITVSCTNTSHGWLSLEKGLNI